MLRRFFRTLAGVFFCVRLSFRLTMLSVAILGPLTMITSLYSSWASSVWSRAWGIQGSITDSARESFSLIRTIRNNACEHRALQTFEEKSRERFAIGMTDAWASGGSALVAQILEVFFFIFVLFSCLFFC
jgi:ABC-type multidrug transport system fused ATPase/permease subunit